MRSILAIIALVAVIGFSMIACGGGDDEGGGGDEDEGGGGGTPSGNIGITGGVIAQNVQVKGVDDWSIINAAELPNYTETKNFGNILFDHELIPITDKIPGSSVQVTSGKLTMTLGIPDASILESPSNFESEGVTVSSAGVKILWLSSILAEDYEGLYCYKSLWDPENYSSEQAYLIYADRDFTVNGTHTYTYEEFTSIFTYNCSFKQGWNFIIIKEDAKMILLIIHLPKLCLPASTGLHLLLVNGHSAGLLR